MSTNIDTTEGLDEILMETIEDSALEAVGKGSAARFREIDSKAKQAILGWVSEVVIGKGEKLVIPEYPRTDDEGEPLYSKRAAAEGRKQVTARYHNRKELRNEQHAILKAHGWKDSK